MLFLKDTISAGASGAIFGLFGAILYFGYHYRVFLGNVIRSQIIPVILLNFMIGLLLPGIDNAAHIGGLLGGVLISAAVGVPFRSTKSDQINGFIMTMISLVFLIYMGFFA
jgi:rhomboid protease GluP